MFKRIRFFYRFTLAYFQRNLKSVARFILFVIFVSVFLVLTYKNFWSPLLEKAYLSLNKTSYAEGIVGSVHSLNPLFESTEAERQLNKLVFRGLTKTDETGKIIPDLAKTFKEVSPLEYEFELRKNIVWDDGFTFSADDVVYTVEASQEPTFSTTARKIFKDVVVKKIDNYKVRFVLKEPFAPFLEQVSLGIIPKHIPLSHYRPVGTGSFRVSLFSADKVVLSNGRLDLNFKFYPDQTRALLALKQGEIKALGGLERADFEQFKLYPNYNLHTKTEATRLTAIFFNTKAVGTSEKLVRQALAYATPKENLLKLVDGGSTLASGPLVKKNSLGLVSKEYFPFDQVKAGSLLEAAGWKLQNGKRMKDGKPLSLTMTTVATKQYQLLASEIGKSWVQIGVDFHIITLNPDEITQVIKNTQFQIVLTTEEISFDPDQYVLWHSTQVNQGNITTIASPKIDKLLEDARKSNDPAIRKEKYSEFTRILADESPAIFLYYPAYNWLVNKNFGNIKLTNFVVPSDRFQNVTEWKIPRFAI